MYAAVIRRIEQNKNKLMIESIPKMGSKPCFDQSHQSIHGDKTYSDKRKVY